MGSGLLMAFLLGLTGSLGHCMGMCGGIGIFLNLGKSPGRRLSVKGRLLVTHSGRITTYILIGALSGMLGGALTMAFAGMGFVQGALAIIAAAFAGYTALAIIGRVPSPDVIFGGAARRWGDTMAQVSSLSSGFPYAIGLVWGLLPCGLVLLAATGAAASGSPLMGAALMGAFGLGTLPALVGIGSFAGIFPNQQDGATPHRTPLWRHAVVVIIAVFGVQMAMRGLASWGLVDHFGIGRVMLW